MIVLERETGLICVRQPDHANLSAEIASSWQRPESLSAGIWGRFVEAVRRHDDGWIEEERAPTLDPGNRPHDFKSLPTSIHLTVWRRGVELAGRRDPYAALLVAQHARGLYSRLRDPGVSPEDQPMARDFIDEMNGEIARLKERLEGGSQEEREAVQPESLLVARRLLSFFDAFSLMLLGAIGSARRTEPLAFSSQESSLSLHFQETEVQADLWPFTRPSLEVEAPALHLPQKTFPDGKDLARRLEEAQATRLRWQIRPG